MAKTTYQPEWIGGARTAAPWQRESADRYAAVKGFLGRYSRPFSVLDLGANAGYFSFRIAEDFPRATVIAVDDKRALRDLAAANALPNAIVIPRRLAAADLRRLANCERFDVALALNVLHHIDNPGAAFGALRIMAQHLIVETPAAGEGAAANPHTHAGIRALVASAAPIGNFPSHLQSGLDRPMTLTSRDETSSPVCQTMDVAASHEGYALLEPGDFAKGRARQAPAMSGIRLAADFLQAHIEIDRKKSGTAERRDFIPGLNLWNYALLGGCRPSEPAALLTDEVARLAADGRWHDDLRPWNFVLSAATGELRAHAIDVGWKRWRIAPEADGLDKCLAMLAAARPAA